MATILTATFRIAIALSASLLLAGITLAESDPVSLEIVPSEINLCSQLAQNRPQMFRVVARNSGATPVGDLALGLIHNTGANFVPPQPAPVYRLAPGSSTQWDFSATEPQDGVLAAKVYFLLSYRTGIKEGSASAQLDVKQRTREPLEKMATAVMSLGSSALDESQPVNGYMIVTNLSEHNIEAAIACPASTGLIFDFPELTSKSMGDCSCGDGKTKCNSVARKLELMAGEVVPVPISISAKKASAGNRKIVFETNLSWNDRGCAYKATVVTTQDLAVNILAQSELLTALGIPSLLLLPGALIMIVVGMMWKAGVRFGNPSTVEFPYQAKTAPEFWVFAISLSFAAVLVGRYVFDRPYLTIYGLTDLMWLWSFSVLIGGLAFFIADIFYLGIIRGLRWWEERYKPLPGEPVREVLVKLGRSKKRCIPSALSRLGNGYSVLSLLSTQAARP